MTSPLTGATLTAQRAVNRWKTYHIAISVPNTIYTARINQTFPSLDNLAQMEYDGGSGTAANVRPGMTCYVGSAAGLSDIGILRVRKALGATTFYFGQTSGPRFANDQYLTFVDNFGLFPRIPTKTDTTEEMDTDLSFDGNAFAPIVRVGPAAVVLELSGATVSYSPIAAIYSPTGATVASYVWTATGTSATANLTTITPTFTWNAVGEYYLYGTITDSAGAVTTVSRKVFVRSTGDATISAPEISGDIDSSGFSARVEGYSGVTKALLRDGALCVIWRKDYAGTARATSYGPYSGATATRFVGWLNGQSLSIDPVTGSASFTIDGPAAWLDRIAGAPMYRQDTSAAPTKWQDAQTLNTDKALYCLVKWYSTLADITDITLTGDTTRIYAANVNTDSLLSQINGLAGEKLQARICFDELGCGFVTIAPSLRTSAGKSANTVLVDLASTDWIDSLDFDRETTAKSAQVEISGSTYDGTTEVQIYARYPGNTPDTYGTPDAPTSTLALASQAVANQLAGDMFADANREYTSVSFSTYWLNDFAGFAMAQGWIIRLSLATGDTPRGLVWTNKRFYILSIGYEYNPETGAESTVYELAEETTGSAGVTYYPPEVTDDNSYDNPPFDGFPAVVPPGFNWFPPTAPPIIPGTGACPSDSPGNSFAITFDPSVLTGTDTVLSSYAFVPCQLRPAAFTSGPTVLEIDLGLEGDMTFTPTMSDRLSVYAIDSGKNRLLTGTIDTTSAPDVCSRCFIFVTFAPVSPLDVAGFEVCLTAGGDDPSGSGSAITKNSISTGSIVNTGSVTFNSFTATQVSANTIRGDFDVTVVDNSSLLLDQFNLNVNLTVSGTASIWMAVFFSTSPNYAYWHAAPPGGSIQHWGNLGGASVLMFTNASGTGTFSLGVKNGYQFDPISIENFVGTLHYTGRFYITSYSSIIPNVRRIHIFSARINNVCPVSA